MESIAVSLPKPQSSQAVSGARAPRYAGRTLSGIAIAFLGFDAAVKVLLVPQVVEASAKLGFSASTVFNLGVILLASVLLYAYPRTSVLGAVLLTGYLGGAIATHVKLGDPLFSHVLFPLYVALFVWGGLFLRDGRLRALFPVKREIRVHRT
jgi:hypothetical protein